jgi:hypothetical protein
VVERAKGCAALYPCRGNSTATAASMPRQFPAVPRQSRHFLRARTSAPAMTASLLPAGVSSLHVRSPLAHEYELLTIPTSLVDRSLDRGTECWMFSLGVLLFSLALVWSSSPLSAVRPKLPSSACSTRTHLCFPSPMPSSLLDAWLVRHCSSLV